MREQRDHMYRHDGMVLAVAGGADAPAARWPAGRGPAGGRCRKAVGRRSRARYNHWLRAASVPPGASAIWRWGHPLRLRCQAGTHRAGYALSRSAISRPLPRHCLCSWPTSSGCVGTGTASGCYGIDPLFGSLYSVMAAPGHRAPLVPAWQWNRYRSHPDS
jgi:hypothetical protein